MEHRAKLNVDRLEARINPGKYQAFSTADPLNPSDTAGGLASLRSENAFGGTVFRSVSTAGRFAVFESNASNLVAGQVDANNSTDIFLYDSVADQTRLISHSVAGSSVAGVLGSQNPTISADGRLIAFESFAVDLVAGYFAPPASTVAPYQVKQVYLYDTVTEQCTLVSHAAGSLLVGGDSTSGGPLISADGSAVGFNSSATNLVAGFVSASQSANDTHSFFYPVSTGQTKLASHNYQTQTTTIHGDSSKVVGLSDDGRYLYFAGSGRDVTPYVLNFHTLFAYDSVTGLNSTVAAPAEPAEEFEDYFSQARNFAGASRVALNSWSQLLVPGYVHGAANSFDANVYLRDFANNTTVLVSHAVGSPSQGGNGQSYQGLISRNGQVVVFASRATDLLSGFADQNGSGYDLFAYDSATQTLELITHDVSSQMAGADGNFVKLMAVSDDGRYVAYSSNASNLIANFEDRNSFDFFDLFLYDRLTGTNKLVSHLPNSAHQSLDGGSIDAAIAGDGSCVYFTSEGDDGDPGVFDANTQADLYRYDIATGQRKILTRRQGATSALAGVEGNSTLLNLTDDQARFLLFHSFSNNVVPGQVDPIRGRDVFLSDRVTGNVVLLSRSISGATVAANGHSWPQFVSPDGSYVLFSSYATDLVAGYVPLGLLRESLFKYECATGQISLITHQPGNPLAAAEFVSGTLGGTYISGSADGRYFVYTSGNYQVIASVQAYVFDRQTNQNRLVGHIPADPDTPGNGRSTTAIVTRDGQRIYFNNHSTDLIAGGQTAHSQIYLFEMVTGEVNLVTHRYDSPVIAANGNSFLDGVSDDGNVISMSSGSSDFIAGGGDTNGLFDIYAYKRLSDSFTLVSHSYVDPNHTGDQGAHISAISGNGRFVNFTGYASNFTPNVTPQAGLWGQVYVADLMTGVLTLASHLEGTTAAVDSAYGQSIISADGRYFLFQSNTLVPGVNTQSLENSNAVYLYDRLTNTNRVFSTAISSTTTAANRNFASYKISRDGRVITFISAADNLVPGDRNGTFDVFYSLQTPPVVESLVVGDGSVQRSLVKSLTVKFDQPLVFTGDPAAAFKLTRNDLPNQPLTLTATVSTTSITVVTLTFAGPLTQSGSLSDGDYTLSVIASQIVGFSTLDGNGDGVAGDDYASAPGLIFRLYGDSNGDRRVDLVDFLAFRTAMFTGMNAAWFDNDGDGVELVDFIAFRQRLGMVL